MKNSNTVRKGDQIWFKKGVEMKAVVIAIGRMEYGAPSYIVKINGREEIVYQHEIF